MNIEYNNSAYFYCVDQVLENIISIRKKLKITQGEIAYEMGISPNMISRLESGKRRVDLKLLQALSELFNMSIDEIINFHKPKNEEESLVMEPSSSYNDVNALKVERDNLIKRIDEMKFTMGVMKNALDKYEEEEKTKWQSTKEEMDRKYDQLLEELQNVKARQAKLIEENSKKQKDKNTG